MTDTPPPAPKLVVEPVIPEVIEEEEEDIKPYKPPIPFPSILRSNKAKINIYNNQLCGLIQQEMSPITITTMLLHLLPCI